MVRNLLNSAHLNFIVGQKSASDVCRKPLDFFNFSFGDLLLSISFFLILNSCILIRMLINQRLLWACIHQLTLINKMCGVLSTGFPCFQPASVAEPWMEAREWKWVQHSRSGSGGSDWGL